MTWSIAVNVVRVQGAGPPQRGQHGLGDGELPGHVHVQLPAERVERHQFGRAGQAVAGVVDQAVQAGRAGEPERGGLADPGRGAGDQGVLACAVHCSSVSCGPAAGEPITW
jgi:hypothetical protein